MRPTWLSPSRLRRSAVSVVVATTALTFLLPPASDAGPAVGAAAAHPISAPADTTPCGPGVGNPSTNNVADYRKDTNVVAADRWSYQNLTTENTPQLLVAGGKGVFPADEWVVDPAKAEHAWYVGSDGAIGTDWRPIAFAYTVGADQNGRMVHIAGKWSSAGGRFRILKSHDGSASTISGPYDTLFSTAGTGAGFDLRVKVATGDDLLFVADQQTAWWVPGKLDATVTTEVYPQTATVTANPDSGAIAKGTPVTLSDATPNACISYTTDGSDPLTSATRQRYTGPITVSADTDVKAVATVDGQQPSPLADLKYLMAEPFRRFLGVDQAPTSDLVAGAQWNRQDIYWSAIEPKKGQIDQAALDKYKQQIEAGLRNGITTLPILDYDADWAANRTGYSFDFHGQTYTYGPVTSVSSDGTQLTRLLTIKNADGSIASSQPTTLSAGNTPPQDVADWQNYVKLVVSQLQPLGIKYFQVWNEAYPGSGFWWGGMDQYMDLIQLPAAQIIHQAGGKVVYGGWIAGAPVSEFIALLDKHDAWRSVDVYDTHYMPLQAMQTIYTEARQRGIQAPAVWQTELGFTPEDEFIADVYPRAFNWALSHQTQPDQFKLFYFADWSPDDPNAFGHGRTLRTGNYVSPNGLTTKGKTLTVLANLLRGSDVQPYTDFTTSPGLTPQLNEMLSTANGFELDRQRDVVAVDLKRQNNADIFVDWNTGDTMHLNFGTPTVTVTFRHPGGVAGIDRVDLLGNRSPLKWTRDPDGSVRVQVPVIDSDPTVHALNEKENQLVFYVELRKS